MPEHIADESGETEKAGLGTDKICVELVAVHPLLPVPVTVYVVLTAGVAETALPDVTDNPAAGNQLYDMEEPEAVNVTAPPGLQY